MTPSWLLVALHGYGGDGAAFATAVAAARPPEVDEPALFAPDGPVPVTLFGTGRGWHGLTRLPHRLRPQVEDAARALVDAVGERQRALGIPPERTAAVGFSQGGTLAARLLQRGGCAAAAAVCAPVFWEGDPPDGEDPSLLCVLGGRDRLMPPVALTADEPIVRSGVARRLERPHLSHVADADALATSLRFVFARVGASVSVTEGGVA